MKLCVAVLWSICCLAGCAYRGVPTPTAGVASVSQEADSPSMDPIPFASPAIATSQPMVFAEKAPTKRLLLLPILGGKQMLEEKVPQYLVEEVLTYMKSRGYDVTFYTHIRLPDDFLSYVKNANYKQLVRVARELAFAALLELKLESSPSSSLALGEEQVAASKTEGMTFRLRIIQAESGRVLSENQLHMPSLPQRLPISPQQKMARQLASMANESLSEEEIESPPPNFEETLPNVETLDANTATMPTKAENAQEVVLTESDLVDDFSGELEVAHGEKEPSEVVVDGLSPQEIEKASIEEVYEDTVRAFGRTLAQAVELSLEQTVQALSWSGRIVHIQGQKIYLNAGRRSQLKLGRLLRVMHEGHDIFHPHTGDFLGRAPGRVKGLLEVIQYFGEDGAIAVVHSGGGFEPMDRVEVYQMEGVSR